MLPVQEHSLDLIVFSMNVPWWTYFSVLEEIWIRQNTWPPLAGLIFTKLHIVPHEFCCYFRKVGLRFSTLGGVRYLQFP